MRGKTESECKSAWLWSAASVPLAHGYHLIKNNSHSSFKLNNKSASAGWKQGRGGGWETHIHTHKRLKNDHLYIHTHTHNYCMLFHCAGSCPALVVLSILRLCKAQWSCPPSQSTMWCCNAE